MIDYEHYLNEKMPQLRIISQTQWDYLKYSNAIDWIDENFCNDDEGRYYAVKILLNLIYYSKRDIEKLLNFGLYEKIYGEIVKNELIQNNNIYIPYSEAEAKIFSLKQLSFFVPLLDSDKPSESGNSIIGDLVHKNDISEMQVDFHWNITEEKLKNFKILIFVDDCVGSGTQLKNFWNSEKTENIRNICNKYDIKVYYLVLVGYDKSLEVLKENKNLQDITVIVCDVLSDKNRIFSPENMMWNKEEDEMEKAIQYFERIRKERGVSFLGFKKLDFAVILHDRLPNWTLPLFWKEMNGWKCLLKRKTT